MSSGKVAVITLKDSPNYGGILQAYALQKVIEKMGYECTLIDYMNDEFRHKFTFFGKPDRMTNIYWLYKKVQWPLMAVMMRKMMPFYRHMNITEHFDDPEELKRLNQNYDVFVTGSDQVWACDLNYYDDSYFLNFVDGEHKRISYAASFGRTVNTLSDKEKAFITPLLQKFDTISVREDSGASVVKQLTGRIDAVPVLDPTFLLDRNDWEQVASHDHKGKEKKYILCYLMQSKKNDTEALKFAKVMSKETGMRIIKICRGLTSVLWGETLYVPTVEQWLGLFMDAEYIITNSFHGVAFSINFNKDFTAYIEGEPQSGRNSRIYDRCKELGLLDRIKIVANGTKVNSKKIEYVKSNAILKELRDESLSILYKSLKG